MVQCGFEGMIPNIQMENIMMSIEFIKYEYKESPELVNMFRHYMYALHTL